MALILYSNGIIEEIIPENLTFTDEELAQSFSDYHTLVSYRLPDIVNTWCLWGVMDNPPDNEYNRIASDIVEDEICSHLFLIHDSEIDPTWNMTDDVLYKEYPEHKLDIAEFINDIVLDIKRTSETPGGEEIEGDNRAMIKLSAVGHTADKRVLFNFDPHIQDNSFYGTQFENFAYKILEFLNENFFESEIAGEKPFLLFADNKTIVTIKNEDIEFLFDKMINTFSENEDFELAGDVQRIHEAWNEYIKLQEQIKLNEQNAGNIANVTTKKKNIDPSTGKRRYTKRKKNEDKNDK